MDELIAQIRARLNQVEELDKNREHENALLVLIRLDEVIQEAKMRQQRKLEALQAYLNT